jgi:hypothetical protein
MMLNCCREIKQLKFDKNNGGKESENTFLRNGSFCYSGMHNFVRCKVMVTMSDKQGEVSTRTKLDKGFNKYHNSYVVVATCGK